MKVLKLILTPRQHSRRVIDVGNNSNKKLASHVLNSTCIINPKAAVQQYLQVGSRLF